MTDYDLGAAIASAVSTIPNINVRGKVRGGSGGVVVTAVSTIVPSWKTKAREPVAAITLVGSVTPTLESNFECIGVGGLPVLGNYDNSGTTPFSSAFMLQRVLAASNTAITRIKVKLAIGACNVRVGIYADSAGEPGAILGQSDRFAVAGGATTITLRRPVMIASGTYYWIATEPSDGINLLSAPGSGPIRYKAGSGANDFPDPAGVGFSTNNSYTLNVGAFTDQTSVSTGAVPIASIDFQIAHDAGSAIQATDTLNVPRSRGRLRVTNGDTLAIQETSTVSVPKLLGVAWRLGSNSAVTAVTTITPRARFKLRSPSAPSTTVGTLTPYLESNLEGTAFANVTLVGNDENGGSNTWNNANQLLMQRFQAATTGSLKSIKVKMASGTPYNFKVGLYADSGGEPGSLLASTGSTPIVSGWNSIAISTVQIFAGTYYWIAVNSDSGSNFYYKSSSGKTFYEKELTFANSFPDPAGVGYSAYTTYDYQFGGVGLVLSSGEICTSTTLLESALETATTVQATEVVNVPRSRGRLRVTNGVTVAAQTSNSVVASLHIAGPWEESGISTISGLLNNTKERMLHDENNRVTISSQATSTVAGIIAAAGPWEESGISTISGLLNNARMRMLHRETNGIQPVPASTLVSTSIINQKTIIRQSSSAATGISSIILSNKELMEQTASAVIFVSNITVQNIEALRKTASSASILVSIDPATLGVAHQAGVSISAGKSLAESMFLGVNDHNSTGTSSANYYVLNQYVATKSGLVNQIHVQCSGSGNVKLGIYADSAGSPTTLLVSVTAAVVAGWNDIAITPTALTSGSTYWLLRNQDTPVIVTQSTTGAVRWYLSKAYTDSFMNPAGGGYTLQTTVRDQMYCSGDLLSALHDASATAVTAVGTFPDTARCTIYYCDYINGSDTAPGDGSATAPFKTIDKASTGITGGQEVRCAKSPDPTALSGTLAWVSGSKVVNTSVDLTGVLAAKDFVRKTTLDPLDNDSYWEIASITSGAITLTWYFRGVSGTVASQKLGVTSTGDSASQDVVVQRVNSSGLSDTSRITISGGWNLTGTPVQDGETWYYQTYATYWGWGLETATSVPVATSYLNITKLNFCRYRRGIDVNSTSVFVTITYVRACGGTIGFLTAGYPVIISNCVANCDVGTSFYLNDGSCTTMDTCSVANGVPYMYRGWVDITNFTIDAATYLYCYGTAGVIRNSTLGNAIYLGRYAYPTMELKFYNNTQSGSTITPSASWVGQPEPDTIPLAVFKHHNTEGNDFAYYSYGKIAADTTHARSGTCIAFTPNSATYYFQHIFKVVADKGMARTVTVYMKKDATFDGTVQASLWFMGVKIVDWVTWTLTTDYVQQSITAASNLITEMGAIELRIKVIKGTTATSVYADDLDYS